MDFPIHQLMDEDACFHYLLDLFHPQGLPCPRCQTQEGFYVHRSFREPVLDYRCRACGRVFNAWTGTALQGTHYRPSQIVLIVRGFTQGVSTAQLARELGCSRRNLLELRHRLQSYAKSGLDRTPLKDPEVEADEMYQNAGEKGALHPDPDDPPRRRANKRRGHGTMENDRPPVLGVVGRDSGAVRLEVVEHADQETLDRLVEETTTPGATVNTDEWSGYNHIPELGRDSGAVRLEVVEHADQETLDRFVEETTTSGATVNTDEWSGYNHIPELGRKHATVCHAPGQREWARDDDGDGVREVHNNTMEGLWTGVRNFLRIFRGIHKKYLGDYIGIFEWGHNVKVVTHEFLSTLLGMVVPNLSP